MDIPQELIDETIDRIWDADDSPSHTTTKAATLISRVWVERSQRYLFHDIRFSTFRPRFRRWCDAMSPGPNGVSRHVRSLTIQVGDADGWWGDQGTLEHDLPFFNSFQKVQVLRVHNWNVEPFPPEVLTRCFTSFAGSVRVLQWDPYGYMPRELWIHIRLFPLVDCLLLRPKPFPAGLLSNTPAGPTRKKLVLSGVRAAKCFVWGGSGLRFREIYIRCFSSMTLLTVIAVVNGDADWLEVLSITGMRTARGVDTSILPSFIMGCPALRELSIDWFPAIISPELHLIDAIPGGSIQSLRVMFDRVLRQKMWNGRFSDIKPSTMMAPYEKLAQAILRLGMRYSGRKISVWLVVPQVPYIMCNPIMECVIAVWKMVEGVVSFGFQMTEAESQNIDKRHPITYLA